MVEEVVRLTVTLTVHEGKQAEFAEVAAAMTAVSKAEPGTLGYEWFASEDGAQAKLVEVYTNSAALEAHFDGTAVQRWVPKLLEVSSVAAFEIYGDPGEKVARMAGGLGAKIFKYVRGIER